MARINIEECWWSDPRRSKLAKLMQSEELADASAIRLWRLAQEFWGKGRELIPLKVWETIEAGPSLLKANLAEVRDDGIYVSGSSQYLDWVYEKREAGRAGGKKSAKARRVIVDDSESKQNEADPSRFKQTQADASKRKQIQPSGSGSGSGSDSGLKRQREENSAQKFENRLNPENQEFIEKLKELEIDSPQLKNNASKIRERFETIPAFCEWIKGVSERESIKKKTTIAAKKDYLTIALLKESGVIE